MMASEATTAMDIDPPSNGTPVSVKGWNRYQKEEVIGQGTYGVVYRAKDKTTGKEVAIKKIKLGNLKDGVSFTAIREIKLLQELKHPNIVDLLDVFVHSAYNPSNGNINLVFEFLETDLEKVIKDTTIILTASDIKYYMLQLLRALDYCHSNWTLHRDIKPNNLLISSTGEVKLADFGLARLFGSPNRQLTDQVVTRWYRAPELLFGARQYSYAIDMWATGCIFAELMLRVPYFAGDSDIDQLGKIFAALGTPTEADWPGMSSLPNYVPFHPCPPTPFRSLFTAASNEALDLLASLLKFDPNARPTAAQALEHPYFKTVPPPSKPEQLVLPKRRRM